MKGWALYRHPYGHTVHSIAGEVSEVASCRQLSGQQGFVIAPFAPSPRHPLLVIQPSAHELSFLHEPLSTLHETDDYHAAFAMFHERLLSGEFQKLVLSRCVDIPRRGGVSPFDLFRMACQRYPRMFISLVCTPQSGLWLTATPEVLLAGDGTQWQTMALAGTIPFADDVRWSDKNIEEQRYVATYIARRLEDFATDVVEQGPRTVRAGHLAHLRSDFRFTLADPAAVGDLVAALHPTPAVCGLPKEAAFRFILNHERHDRAYYSGFMGPLAVDGRTSLFVTLRCMQIFSDAYRLYAGGGLLPDSREEQELQETETKLDTIRQLINVQQ